MFIQRTNGLGRDGDGRHFDLRVTPNCRRSRPRSVTGTVERVFTAPEAGEPMERRDQVAAREGGLVGDRYYEGTGHYSPYDVCEVTLVSAAALARVREDHGIDLSDGRHRRNLVVAGVDVHDLLDATVRVGGAELRGTRPRPPCAHVEAVADEPGLAAALRDGRGGVGAAVERPGSIAEGDDVEVVTPDPETMGERIVERLREEAEE
jgi:MOSC domain-containing protein YiiM